MSNCPLSKLFRMKRISLVAGWYGIFARYNDRQASVTYLGTYSKQVNPFKQSRGNMDSQLVRAMEQNTDRGSRRADLCSYACVPAVDLGRPSVLLTFTERTKTTLIFDPRT